jgi:hypothetical protein
VRVLASDRSCVRSIAVLRRVAWAAVINTVSAPGISDIVLVIVVLVFIFIAFILGLLPVMRIGGAAVLGLIGGVAFGLRLALLKAGLLIPIPAVNWVLVVAFALAFGYMVVWKIRIGLVRDLSLSPNDP